MFLPALPPEGLQAGAGGVMRCAENSWALKRVQPAGHLEVHAAAILLRNVQTGAGWIACSEWHLALEWRLDHLAVTLLAAASSRAKGRGHYWVAADYRKESLLLTASKTYGLRLRCTCHALQVNPVGPACAVLPKPCCAAPCL